MTKENIYYPDDNAFDRSYKRARYQANSFVAAQLGSKAADLLTTVPDFAYLICKLMLDPDVPSSRKLDLGLALLYVLSPLDLVPDSVPLEHHMFGMMLGKDGKPFKTRAGGTVKLSDLLDEALERADLHLKVKVRRPEAASLRWSITDCFTGAVVLSKNEELTGVQPSGDSELAVACLDGTLSNVRLWNTWDKGTPFVLVQGYFDNLTD